MLPAVSSAAASGEDARGDGGGTIDVASSGSWGSGLSSSAGTGYVGAGLGAIDARRNRRIRRRQNNAKVARRVRCEVVRVVVAVDNAPPGPGTTCGGPETGPLHRGNHGEAEAAATPHLLRNSEARTYLVLLAVEPLSFTPRQPLPLNRERLLVPNIASSPSSRGEPTNDSGANLNFVGST